MRVLESNSHFAVSTKTIHGIAGADCRRHFRYFLVEAAICAVLIGRISFYLAFRDEYVMTAIDFILVCGLAPCLRQRLRIMGRLKQSRKILARFGIDREIIIDEPSGL